MKHIPRAARDRDEDGDGIPDRFGRDPILGSDGSGGGTLGGDGPPVMHAAERQTAASTADQSAGGIEKPIDDSIADDITTVPGGVERSIDPKASGVDPQGVADETAEVRPIENGLWFNDQEGIQAVPESEGSGIADQLAEIDPAAEHGFLNDQESTIVSEQPDDGEFWSAEFITD